MIYSKVRAITRIATPVTEGPLLAIARAGTASHVERVVSGYRRANRKEENARARRQDQRGHLRTWTDEDGMLVIEVRLTPEQGAPVQKALEAAMKELRSRDSAEGSGGSAAPRGDSAEASVPTVVTRSAEEWTPSQRRADALTLMAESALAAGLRRGTEAELTGSLAAGAVPERTGAERTMVVVHVDAEVLARTAISCFATAAARSSPVRHRPLRFPATR